jgi:hypothetical protein
MHGQRFPAFFFWLLAAFFFFMPAFGFQSESRSPASIERISPEEARSRVQAGKAILVCAYDDKRCEGKMLQGALTRREFEERQPSLSKEQEIITYCS